jgi:DNA-binding MarR family transcriptional regulator
MTEETIWYENVVFPALWRGARSTYGSAIRGALSDAGCDDMPRSGSYVLGAITGDGSPLSQIIEELGVSKQAAGQLVDTLVNRGYLERKEDPADRRRLTVSLTERGRFAASTAKGAIDDVDAHLAEHVGAAQVLKTRETLAALVGIGHTRQHLAIIAEGVRLNRATDEAFHSVPSRRGTPRAHSRELSKNS